VGPLDQLILHGRDLEYPDFIPFLDFLEFEDQLSAFPPIKELTISYPPMTDSEGPIATVEPTESEDPPGAPFERVVFRVGMAEMLELWVDVADCNEEQYTCVHDE